MFNRKKHRYKKWIKMSHFDKIERGIIEAIINKAGGSKEILNEDW